MTMICTGQMCLLALCSTEEHRCPSVKWGSSCVVSHVLTDTQLITMGVRRNCQTIFCSFDSWSVYLYLHRQHNACALNRTVVFTWTYMYLHLHGLSKQIEVAAIVRFNLVTHHRAGRWADTVSWVKISHFSEMWNSTVSATKKSI